jgi:hypothetical protein
MTNKWTSARAKKGKETEDAADERELMKKLKEKKLAPKLSNQTESKFSPPPIVPLTRNVPCRLVVPHAHAPRKQ